MVRKLEPDNPLCSRVALPCNQAREYARALYGGGADGDERRTVAWAGVALNLAIIGATAYWFSQGGAAAFIGQSGVAGDAARAVQDAAARAQRAAEQAYERLMEAVARYRRGGGR